VRSITLNFENSPDIYYPFFKVIVTVKVNKCVTVVNENKIARCLLTGHVIIKRETKDYKIILDKRVIEEDYAIVPFGM